MKIPFESGDIRVTSPYGMREGEMHKGIDLVSTSSLRVVAVEDAVVAVSTIVTDRESRTWEWGNYVRLDLSDGRRLYHCHLAERLVRAGERVKKGQVIGIAGSTGKSTGVHLHWELRPKGFSLESLDIAAYSGIPNQKGIYDVQTLEKLPEERVDRTYTAGERVVIAEGAVYTNGVKVPSKYTGVPYTVSQVQNGRVLIKELYSWVETRYLSPADGAKELFSVSDKVVLLSGAAYSTGQKVPSRYLGKTFTVQAVREERVLISELNSWVLNEGVKRV